VKVDTVLSYSRSGLIRDMAGPGYGSSSRVGSP
jgi:hypothetical protein